MVRLKKVRHFNSSRVRPYVISKELGFDTGEY